MLARKETSMLRSFFEKLEWIIHNVVVFLYACVGVLIVPFVQVYTNGVTDANYTQPLFAFVFTLASAVYCLRLPYHMIVNAAGHYKQTQTSSIIEMFLNISITLFLVNRFGLVGAAIGTLVSLSYRTIYLAYYLSKNILLLEFNKFIVRVLKDIAITIIIIIITTSFFEMSEISYFGWITLAIKVAVVAGIELLVFNVIFDKKHSLSLFAKYKR